MPSNNHLRKVPVTALLLGIATIASYGALAQKSAPVATPPTNSDGNAKQSDKTDAVNPKSNIKVVTLDFSRRHSNAKEETGVNFDRNVTFTPLGQSVRIRTPVVLQITHINLYKYKVEVSAAQQTFNTTVPEVLKTNLSGTVPKAAVKMTTDPNVASEPEKGSVNLFNFAANKILDVAGLPQTLDAIGTGYEDTDKLHDDAIKTVTDAFKQPEISAGSIRQLTDGLFADLDTAYINVPTTDAMYQEIKTRYEKIKSSRDDVDKSMATVQTFFSKVTDGSMFTYTFGPVIPTEHELDFKLKLTPKNETAIDLGNVAVLHITGNSRPTFSTGVFFALVKDPTYYKDSGGKARQGVTDDLNTTFGALVHVPLLGEFSNDFSIQASFGLGLKGGTPQFFVGPSFIFGRQQRAVFTVGLVETQVNRLSGLSLGDAVTGDQPTTSKVYRPGLFVGFSFNFE